MMAGVRGRGLVVVTRVDAAPDYSPPGASAQQRRPASYIYYSKLTSRYQMRRLVVRANTNIRYTLLRATVRVIWHRRRIARALSSHVSVVSAVAR